MSIDALTAIREEADRLSAALAATDPEQKVPTCPDWNAADLLWHATEVPEFWSAVLSQRIATEEGAARIDESAAPRPDDLEELQQRRAAAVDGLLEQLGARPDEESAWFWFSERQDVGVIRSMQLHEATIHRVDAELTAGLPVTAIREDIAHAGLEHVLKVMWPAAFDWIPEWSTTTPVAIVEITAEGGAVQSLLISRWSGTRPRDGKEFDAPVGRLLDRPAGAGAGAGADAGAEADVEFLPRATVTGSATALDIWAWGRSLALGHLAGGPETVEIVGDPAAIDQLEALLARGLD
ncbi:maleylpyruvate isomerase family mycothiol-dependent enzyme [Brachybacterium sp. AOP3-A1-3]|uniref:maleylpyruvate isomerase family mycothiol-dependent enzyme n=1 Tax=Brachybacterium sp. AOP3-A1-3 TaxID=3457699 RepID=UPI0040333402